MIALTVSWIPNGYFNKLTYNETTQLNIKKIDEIFKYLNKRWEDGQKKDNLINRVKEEYDGVVENMDEEKNELKEDDVSSDEEKEIDPRRENLDYSVDSERSQCCPFHCYDHFEATKHPDVLEAYQAIRKKADEENKKKLAVLILGKELVIDTGRMCIDSKSITFNERIASVNFASCWNGPQAEHFIHPKKKEVEGYKDLPPILYQTHEDGHHLRIELFNSNFVRMTKEKIVEYEIKNEPNEDFDEYDY